MSTVPQQYHVILDEIQLKVMVQMADLYSRIGMGHLEVIAEQLQMGDVGNQLSPLETVAGVEALTNSLKQAKYHFFGLSSGAHHAIRAPAVPDRFKVAYDIQQVLRYAVCQVSPEEHRASVWNSKPMQSSTVTLPVCVPVQIAASRPMKSQTGA